MGIIGADANLVVTLPENLNSGTIYPVLRLAIDEHGNTTCSAITFDFSRMLFIEPIPVVVLCNLIEYFVKLGIAPRFTGMNFSSAGVAYLDDAGFFARYLEAPLRKHAARRDTTLTLGLVENPRSWSYVNHDMIPWLAQRLNTTAIALGTVKVCFEEIFNNIADHSGVSAGWVFGQHFPQKKEVHLAVSDFGVGIKPNVAKVKPGVSDSDALRLAIREGFTSKSNVQNRGAGLAILMRYVAERNHGAVFIESGKGRLSAVFEGTGMKATARERTVWYPGTLIHVILKTDTLSTLYEDSEPEDFSW